VLFDNHYYVNKHEGWILLVKAQMAEAKGFPGSTPMAGGFQKADSNYMDDSAL